jgi:hypothetical protein
MEFKARLQFLSETQLERDNKGYAWVVSMLLAAASIYDLICAQFVPDPASAPRLAKFVWGIEWYVWAIASLTIACGLLFEGGYRASRKRDRTISALTKSQDEKMLRLAYRVAHSAEEYIRASSIKQLLKTPLTALSVKVDAKQNYEKALGEIREELLARKLPVEVEGNCMAVLIRLDKKVNKATDKGSNVIDKQTDTQTLYAELTECLQAKLLE